MLAARPQLKIVANMAVGYNNFDVPAMTAAGVLGTNAPDALTETTADFWLCTADGHRPAGDRERTLPARREVDEVELRPFAGAEVHGSTLGILGMGRIGQGIARRGALGSG